MVVSYSRDRIRSDFDRIALLEDASDDPSERLHADLLHHLPKPCSRALDVGCGTGRLTRKLAARADHVLGLDISPRMIEVARARSTPVGLVEYRVADVMTEDLAPGSFDAVTAVAMLHHVPLREGVERLAGLVAPGGVLLVIDLYEVLDLEMLPFSGATWLMERVRSLKSRPVPPEVREAWREHGKHDRYPTMSEIRGSAEGLAGARIRKHFHWRWSLVWRRD